jgi:hypothetical protein
MKQPISFWNVLHFSQDPQSTMWYRNLNELVVSATERKVYWEGTGQHAHGAMWLVYAKRCFGVRENVLTRCVKSLGIRGAATHTIMRRDLMLYEPPIQWVPEALSLGLKRPWREADHSPPPSSEVKEGVELYLHSPMRLYGAVLS